MYNLSVVDTISYIEDQSRDRSESLYMDHGQSVRKVTLPGSYEEQPEHKKKDNKLDTSSVKYLSSVVML